MNSSLVAHVIQARFPSPGKRPFHDHDHDQDPESRSGTLQITVFGGKCIPVIIFIGIWDSYAKSLLLYLLAHFDSVQRSGTHLFQVSHMLLVMIYI